MAYENTMVVFFIASFVALFPMLDPFGNMPIFAGLTEGIPNSLSRRVAVRAHLIALSGILFFAFFGQELFSLFGITIHGLRVVGGIIFFVMGYDMLQARLARTKVSDTPTNTQMMSIDDMAVTPLGIPLICGPGAMTGAMLQMAKAQSVVEQMLFVGAALTSVGISLALFIGSKPVLNLIGPSGSKVLLRLMGLILMIMAVESFFAGLKPIIQDILQITPLEAAAQATSPGH